MALKDLILNYDNKTINNSFIKGKELILQKVVLALQCWTGDWFLNGDIGIPYDLRIENKSLLLGDIQDVILSVDGVNSVQDLQIKIYDIGEKYSQRVIDISATVITTEEEVIELNGIVPIVGI